MKKNISVFNSVQRSLEDLGYEYDHEDLEDIIEHREKYIKLFKQLADEIKEWDDQFLIPIKYEDNLTRDKILHEIMNLSEELMAFRLLNSKREFQESSSHFQFSTLVNSYLIFNSLVPSSIQGKLNINDILLSISNNIEKLKPSLPSNYLTPLFPRELLTDSSQSGLDNIVHTLKIEYEGRHRMLIDKYTPFFESLSKSFEKDQTLLVQKSFSEVVNSSPPFHPLYEILQAQFDLLQSFIVPTNQETGTKIESKNEVPSVKQIVLTMNTTNPKILRKEKAKKMGKKKDRKWHVDSLDENTSLPQKKDIQRKEKEKWDGVENDLDENDEENEENPFSKLDKDHENKNENENEIESDRKHKSKEKLSKKAMKREAKKNQQRERSLKKDEDNIEDNNDNESDNEQDDQSEKIGTNTTTPNINANTEKKKKVFVEVVEDINNANNNSLKEGHDDEWQTVKRGKGKKSA